MPLFVVHNHVHIDFRAIEAKLDKLIKITTMSQETLDALMAKAESATTSLINIRQDIADIKASLPTEGGLTAEEVAQLAAKLDTLSGDAAQLDSENE